MVALVIGGSGSGKSAFAEGLMARLDGRERIYLATMRAQDDESRARVARHRGQRARGGYRTLEWPMDLALAPVGPGASVLLEDLPNLLANEMFGGGDGRRVGAALSALAARCANLVMVTGDVFADGERYDGQTEAYRRSLARLTAEAAALADAVIEVVAGIPIWIKGEETCGLFTRC